MVLCFSNLITLSYKLKIRSSQHSVVLKLSSINVIHFPTNEFTYVKLNRISNLKNFMNYPLQSILKMCSVFFMIGLYLYC